VRADVCADINRDIAGPQPALVAAHRVGLERAEQEDRKINAFVQIEHPAQAATRELRLRRQSPQPPPCLDETMPALGDENFLSGAEQIHVVIGCFRARASPRRGGGIGAGSCARS
jgi:hypothetical protein